MIFFVVLAVVAFNLERIADYENRSKEIIGRLNWLSYLTAAAMVTNLETRSSDSSDLHDRARKNQLSLRLELDDTAQLFRSPETRSLFSSFAEASLAACNNKSITQKECDKILNETLPILRKKILQSERNKSQMARR